MARAAGSVMGSPCLHPGGASIKYQTDRKNGLYQNGVANVQLNASFGLARNAEDTLFSNRMMLLRAFELHKCK